MAFSKALAASLLVSILVLHLAAESDLLIKPMVDSPASSPHPPQIDCDRECDRRCKLSSRPRLCKRACGTCCDRCNCVPSGTSGHYDECPCYANMTTHGRRHKCP